MSRIFSLLVAVSIMVSGAQALDRKPLDEVIVDAMLGETQVMPSENGVAHTTLFWWLPSEYWEAVFSQDDTINARDAEKIETKLETVDSVDPDLSMVLDMLKPVLAASIGEMGNNMHFLVLEHEPGQSGQSVDPYGAGRIELRAKRRDGEQLQANIELPLDSLHVPRMCPNGKPAHVSWKFCPWSGERLK